MVGPITGPFTYQNLTSDSRHYAYTVGYKQKPPFNLPLVYEARKGDVMRAEGSSLVQDASGVASSQIASQATHDDVKNRAREKFKSLVSDPASLGVTFAEMNQAVTMMRDRAIQLYRFSRAVRKFQFSDAASILKLGIRPKGVSRHKSFANNWLEFHFGWEPLIKDLYQSLDVYTRGLPPFKASCMAQSVWNSYSGTSTGPIWSNSAHIRVVYSKVGGTISVNNPNSYLMASLGLANPSVVAWELVPFSFVVDWFTTVGQCLSASTDFLGLTIINGYTVSGEKGSSLYKAFNAYNVAPNTLYRETHLSALRMKRATGIPTPTLMIRPYKTMSITRAATAVALLVTVGLKR